ncbi:MAG: HEPN domain-containing protein [Candidatus Paceibacteria bacterium]
MQENNSENYKSWFKLAQQHIVSARGILDSEVTPDVCFLSHQVAEKCLKGLLEFSNQTPPKIHDLLRLESLIEEDFDQITSIHEQLKLLNQYYLPTRYPDIEYEMTDDEARKAFEAAKEVNEFVFDIIEQDK